MAKDEGEHKSNRAVKFSYGLVTLESERAALALKRLANSRANLLFVYLGVPIFVGLGLVAFYLVLSSLGVYIVSSSARQAASSIPLQNYLLIPGLNTFVPIFYGLLGIVIAVTVHEGSHGVMSWREGVSLEGAGVILFLFVPLGAYVRPSEKELESKSSIQKINVVTAGITANMILGALCLGVLVLLILPTVAVAAPAASGVQIFSVASGSPASRAGLLPGDIIRSIAGYNLENSTQLSQLESTVLRPGENVSVVTSTGKVTYAVLEKDPYNSSIAILGITTYSPAEALSEWKHPTSLLIYFLPASYFATPLNPAVASSYTSKLPDWQSISNTFYWIWWMNINLGIFNALPANPLDGGKVILEVFRKLLGSTARAESAANVLSAIVFSLVFLLIILPRLP